MAKYTRFDPRNKKQNKNKYKLGYDSFDKIDKKSKTGDRYELMHKIEEYEKRYSKEYE